MSASFVQRVLLACVPLAGCATVDPSADYERIRQHARRATGVDDAFDPQTEMLIAERVDEMLADGLSAGEAAEIALLNNPQLHAAFRDVGMARADVVQAGLLSNPTLGMAFRLPAGGGLSALDLDIGQQIADLWQIPVRKRAAERSLERSIFDIARQASVLATEATSAYYAALGEDARLSIARENLDISRTTLELTEFRQQAGAGSALDVNLSRGSVLDAQLALERQRLAAAEARRSLGRALGLVRDMSTVKLTESLPEAPRHRLAAEALVNTALRERLDYLALGEAVRAADENLALEYRRVFPSVQLGLSLEREPRGPAQGRDILADTARASIASGTLTAPEIQPRSARDTDENIALGPSFSVVLPVFDQNQAQIARARYAWQQARDLTARMERMIHQDVRSAVDQAETAWRVARFYRDEMLPQAEQNLQLARESYRAGKTGVLAAMDAERSLLAARDSYASALAEAAGAVPRLERTIGLPIAEIVVLEEAEEDVSESGPITVTPVDRERSIEMGKP